MVSLEEFPDLEITNDLFEIDGNRITCSGGTASLDLMLNLITVAHPTLPRKFPINLYTIVSGNPLTDREWNFARVSVSVIQNSGCRQSDGRKPRRTTSSDRDCKKTNLSTRQLERLFRKYLNTTPTRYYLNLRLARARHLLRQTSMSILSVALACGFVSASHFSKCYREYYGRTPRAERNPRYSPIFGS